MVRVYKRKTDRGSSYTRENLQLALEEIKSGTMTVKRAAENFNIPKSTIKNHLTGRRGLNSTSFGRSTAIPQQEEERLANGLKTMEKWGWGLSRKEVLQVVGEYVEVNKIKSHFKGTHPGEDWFLGFKKRNKLSIKKPENLEYARLKSTDPFIIGDYFSLLSKTIEELGIEDKPERIFNLDETSFSLDPFRTKVVGGVNQPSSRTTTGTGRENTTVLLGGNAAGHKLPPLIIFTAAYVWDTWIAPQSKAFPDMSYAASPNGWMDSRIFFNYFIRVFLTHCGEERPILLVYDGHASHLDIRLVNAAVENNVTILKLPAHTSHLLQPMDVAVFKGLKSTWDEKLTAWQRKNIGVKLMKMKFSTLISKVWSELNPENIRSGFEKSGIFPFNKDVVDTRKFDPESLKRYELYVKNQERGLNPHDKNIIGESMSGEAEMQAEPGPSTYKTGTKSISASNETTTHSINNNITKERHVSFEDLLLRTVKPKKVQEDAEKKKKRRVSQKAEVITSVEARDRLENKLSVKKSSQIRKKNCNDKKNKKILIESDTEDDLMEINSSSDESYTLEEMLQAYEEDERRQKEEEEADKGEPEAGKWVLTKFATKRIIKCFVGQILSKQDDELTVKFTKIKTQSEHHSIFVWAEPEDISCVDANDIERILPEPKLGRRGELQFQVSFAGYDME